MEQELPIWEYDIEVYRNLFSATFWEEKSKTKKVFSLFNGVNQLLEMVHWIKSFNGKLILVGYNSSKYDDIIITNIVNRVSYFLSIPEIEVNTKLYNLSLLLIQKDVKQRTKQEREFLYNLQKITPSLFKSIDLLEVIREGYAVKSLKGVAINLKFPKIQDLPYPFDKELTPSEGVEVIEYNFNDVQVTTAIRLFIKDRLHMRKVLSEKFGVDLSSSADSTIAKKIFDKKYSELSGIPIDNLKNLRTSRKELVLKDIILPWITFKTPLYQEWFERLKEVKVTNIQDQPEFDIPSLVVDDMTYIIGLGGIHSVDKPGIFTNEGNMLLDLDVASQYPTRLIHSKIAPAHLDANTFSFVLEEMVKERLHNKKLGKTDDIARIIAEGLKISVNTVYGLLIFAYYFLYDPLAGYKVTINNQLCILMLIEELNQHGITIISANTDGIICYTNNSNLELIRTCYRSWESLTGFTLEETNYSKYIRRDINNYITIKTNGEVKNKGIFIPQNGILKGYDKPIVSIALQEYFLHNKKPEDVIKNLGYEYKFVNPDFPHGEIRKTDIYDYCMAKKVGDTFEGAYLANNQDINNLQPLQKNLRYYASNSGDSIFKIKKVVGKADSYSNMLVSSPITLFNDYIEKESSEECPNPYDINYQYYLDETYKIIYKIEGRKWVDKTVSEAKLTKLQEELKDLQEKLQTMVTNKKEHLKSFTLLASRIVKKEEQISLYFQQEDGSDYS